MPPAKHSSTMIKAMGLISLLFDIISTQNVPFAITPVIMHAS